jgi:hypothetical protein
MHISSPMVQELLLLEIVKVVFQSTETRLNSLIIRIRNRVQVYRIHTYAADHAYHFGCME